MKLSFSLNVSGWAVVLFWAALTVWEVIDPGNRMSAAAIGAGWGAIAMHALSSRSGR